MADMLKTSGFTAAIGYDFSEAFAIANPAKTATLTQIIAAKGIKSTDNIIVQKILKELSKDTYSGGKAEGADAADAEKTKRTTVRNAMEIFSKVASISGTAKAINSAAYAEELLDRMSEVKEDENKALLTGTLSEADPRKMKGLINFAANTVTMAGDVLAEAELDVSIQKLKTTTDVRLAVNPADMLAVQRALIGDKATITLATSEVVAGIYITEYVSAQGVRVKLYAESALTAGTYLLYDMDKVEYYELRPLHVEELSKKGDADEAQVIVEGTCIANPASLVVIKKK